MDNNTKIEAVETATGNAKNEVSPKEAKFQWTKDRIVLAIIFTIIMLVSIALLIIIIVNDEFLFNVVRDFFIRPLLGIHLAWSILIFLGLMILQSLFAPIPSELILLSGGILFGIPVGSIVGVAGSMLSATVTFYLSKRGGRSIIDATGNKIGIIDRTIFIFDEWIRRWGLWAIIVGRAVPVIMFDPVSYAAGLSKVKDWQYFLATFIGSVPRAIFYAFMGQQLIGNNPPEKILEFTKEEVEAIAGQFNLYFFIIFGILVFMFILSNVLYYIFERKKKQKAIEQAKPIGAKQQKEIATEEQDLDSEPATEVDKNN